MNLVWRRFRIKLIESADAARSGEAYKKLIRLLHLRPTKEENVGEVKISGIMRYFSLSRHFSVLLSFLKSTLLLTVKVKLKNFSRKKNFSQGSWSSFSIWFIFVERFYQDSWAWYPLYRQHWYRKYELVCHFLLRFSQRFYAHGH